MSFGTPGSSRGRTAPHAGSPCPCTSGAAFGECCAPLLAGNAASTAVRLMRSRYTAFVVGDVIHLERTWHPRTRPAVVDLDPDLTWTGLTVEAVEGGGATDEEGVVEFRASWVAPSGEQGVLHERSRFTRRARRWMYLDGDVSEHAPRR